MYGINLKYRFLMLCAMIGSGLAGLSMRPERRYGEWHRRRRPAGNSLDSTELLAGVCAGNGHIAIIILIVLTSFIYQRKYRLGTLDIV